MKLNNLTDELKSEKRNTNLKVLKSYLKKFPNEVENKYTYKEEYISLIEKVKKVQSSNPIFQILLDVLNSSEYINIKENSCINSIFKQILKRKASDFDDIINSYKILLTIPFEL